jgi:hypothetical protein
MSADIIKESCYDDRVVQTRPKFAVSKGALSLTNVPYSAISQTTTQHTFQIYVPSENVFADRALEWSSACFLRVDVATANPVPLNQPVRVLGQDMALSAFPLNSLLTTLQATINDTTTTINSSDVLKDVLRLTDYKENRLQRTCPTQLDSYLAYSDGNGAINTPLGSYSSQTAHDITPNGAYPYIVFTDPNGIPLAGNGTYTVSAINYAYVNGVPVGDGVKTAFPLFVRWSSTEKLVLSPFVFADIHEWSTGFFGLNNISIVANLGNPSRVLRNDPSKYGGTTIVTSYNNNPNNGAFQNSQVNIQFLTPPLSIELPPKNVVEYMEFPRYISPAGDSLAPGAVTTVQSQTITLPQIPDFLIVFVRASPTNAVAYAPEIGDGYLPIATRNDGARAPLSVQFDNFSGLLSSHTAEQLYSMCVHNGLEMDWATWTGRGQVAGANPSAGGALGGNVSLVGGPLVLRMGQDITLQEGQAPSLVGNFTLQLNLQVKNNYAFAVNPQMVVITANSGFFETIRGSSRIIKGVLSEQDIISAPMANAFTCASMKRLVGSGFMSNLSSALSKAKELYHRTKPVVSAVKGALGDEGMSGKIKGALGAVGYGMEGSAMGAGMGAGMGMVGRGTGAGRHKKSLAERLM